MIQSCIALCCLEQLLSSHKGHPRICHITKNYMADKMRIEERICELEPSARRIIDFVEAHWTSIGSTEDLQRWIGAIIESVPQYEDQSLRAHVASKTYVDFATASAVLYAAAPVAMINEMTWNEVCKYLAPAPQSFYEAFTTYQERIMKGIM